MTAVTTPIPGIPFRDQDYRKLIEDLVEDDARKWGMARFVRGSITGASVSSRDDSGRPTKITAPYAWIGLSRSQGVVTLTFSDGLPECLTYSETPTVCHAPNRAISAKYAEGGYPQ